MSDQYEFLGSNDKPALVAFSTPEWLEEIKQALQELGYKVHTAATHSDFLVRFSQVQYQVVVVEERFAANSLDENQTMTALQRMPVGQRRHSTIILVGESFQTFTPMQAFQQSVHAVINSSELFLVKQLIEKSVADNKMFLHSFNDVQARLYTTPVR
jgi:hypothetical protein